MDTPNHMTHSSTPSDLALKAPAQPPQSVDEVLSMRWAHDPDRQRMRLVEPDGVQAVSVQGVLAELPLPDHFPEEDVARVATSLNIHTWKAEAQALYERTADPEAGELRDLTAQAITDRQALLELERRSGIELPPLAHTLTPAEDVLSARWQSIGGEELHYAGPSSRNSLGERSSEEPHLSPPSAGPEEVDRMARWMTVEAWRKEATDRLGSDAVTQWSSYEVRGLEQVRDLSQRTLEGDAAAAAQLEQRTGLALDFDPAWVEQELPHLKAEVARAPVDPDLRGPWGPPDPYGWQKERFEQVGVSLELGEAAEGLRGLVEHEHPVTRPDDVDVRVARGLLDQGFSAEQAEQALLKLSPQIDDRHDLPQVYVEGAVARAERMPEVSLAGELRLAASAAPER